MIFRRLTVAMGISGGSALLATLLGLGLVTPPLGYTAPQAQDPAAVVAGYFAAIDAGDADAAAALYTDNAIFVRAPASGFCSRQSPCLGRPAILAGLRHVIAERTCFTVIDEVVTGSVVTSRIEVRNDPLRALGIERTVNQYMAFVEQGRIAAHYGLGDLSDPHTAGINAIAGGAPPPSEPRPVPPCR